MGKLCYFIYMYPREKTAILKDKNSVPSRLMLEGTFAVTQGGGLAEQAEGKSEGDAGIIVVWLD